MQTTFQTSLTPEQYVEQDYQHQVSPPENCPICCCVEHFPKLAARVQEVAALTGSAASRPG